MEHEKMPRHTRKPLDVVAAHIAEHATIREADLMVSRYLKTRSAELAQAGEHGASILLEHLREKIEKEIELMDTLQSMAAVGVERTIVHGEDDEQQDDPMIMETAVLKPRAGESSVNLEAVRGLLEDVHRARLFLEEEIEEHYPEEARLINHQLRNQPDLGQMPKNLN